MIKQKSTEGFWAWMAGRTPRQQAAKQRRIARAEDVGAQMEQAGGRMVAVGFKWTLLITLPLIFVVATGGLGLIIVVPVAVVWLILRRRKA